MLNDRVKGDSNGWRSPGQEAEKRVNSKMCVQRLRKIGETVGGERGIGQGRRGSGPRMNVLAAGGGASPRKTWMHTQQERPTEKHTTKLAVAPDPSEMLITLKVKSGSLRSAPDLVT